MRFFNKVAYAVTFERTDPFYVLNVTDPYHIDELAAVEITGFSNYLHSMNDENCLILALGEDADTQGRVLGLQVSVFDACDVNNVTVTRHNIEDEEDVYSYSSASFDVKALRYNRETGRLVIPVDIDAHYSKNTESFHGFKTFLVTEDSITESCSVETGNDADNGGICYSCRGHFAPRSMIFGGDLTTTKTHFVTSTNLDTCKTIWQFDVQVDKHDDNEHHYGCCGYW